MFLPPGLTLALNPGVSGPMVMMVVASKRSIFSQSGDPGLVETVWGPHLFQNNSFDQNNWKPKASFAVPGCGQNPTFLSMENPVLVPRLVGSEVEIETHAGICPRMQWMWKAVSHYTQKTWNDVKPQKLEESKSHSYLNWKSFRCNCNWSIQFPH